MAITSGFFDSIDGDRKYNAEQISNYFEGLIGNGIFENVGNKMQVTAGDLMSVNVGSGRAMIKCHWVKNDASVNLTLDDADVQYGRIDAIVLRLNTSDRGRQITLEVKKGTLASKPSKPSATRTADVYELILAYVKINPKVTQIKQSDIMDQRLNTSLCGYVTGLIKQVDTSQLFKQYTTAFDDYYNTMTSQFTAYITEKQKTFDDWYDKLTDKLTVDTSLHQYKNTVETSGTTTKINIGIPEYKADDILFVFINGVMFVEGDEYTVSGTGDAARITLVNDIKGDNAITFIVLASEIGSLDNNSVAAGFKYAEMLSADTENIIGNATVTTD